MYYCTNCHRVTPERTESCPYCNKFGRLRPAEEADECRLTELDALNASVLESLLKEANVPYIARPMMGAGISAALGVTLEKFVFFVAYREKLMTILKKPASRKNHTNVLMHIQGYFRNQLNSRQRVELRDVILHYRDGLLPILAPLTLLKHYMAEYPDRYLMTQNYFDPYPDDLGLRLAVT